MAKSKFASGMGFRGVSDFNECLMGKQYRRLMTGKPSLFQRVFKSRYYPRTSIREARLGYTPSYAWRSILGAKELIDEGSRWRIGNGQQVNIMGDNWIPDLPGFKIHEHVRGIGVADKVSELIDVDLRCWKKKFIQSCFGPVVTSNICSIPLPWSELEDKVVWHSEKDDIYSVKSAYHLLQNKRAAASPGPSRNSQEKIWKNIWRVPIHNRVRNFLWRLVKDILPTRMNLQRKGINTVLECPLCHCYQETTDHLFLHCILSKLVWFASPLGLRIHDTSNIEFWLEKVLNDGNSLGTQLFCVTLWKIWNTRDWVLFNDEKFVPPKVALDVRDWVYEYNKSNPEKKASRGALRTEEMVSEDSGLSKIYVDAACFNDCTIAMGCVMKNIERGVFFSASQKLSMGTSSSVAEAMAVRWALKLAKDLHIPSVMIQSDALEVVDCNNQVSSVAVLEPLVLDCLNLLKSFQFATLLYVNRSHILEAHNLVGLGYMLGSRTWLGYPSSDLIRDNVTSVSPS